MTETKEQPVHSEDDPKVNAQDLDLLDDSLEDEGKDDAALWDEIDESESAAPEDDPKAPDKGGEEVDQGAAKPESDSAAQEGDETSPHQGQSDGDPPSDDAQAQDIWAHATPEQRAAYEAAQDKLQKLEQADRSNRGRLSAMQRKVNAVIAQPSREEDDGFLKSKDWTSFKEEYPEVAGPMEKVIGSLQTQVTRQNKELSAIGDERRQSALEEQETILADQYKDWEDVVADDGFETWIGEQPRHIQEAAARNGKEIVDAAEAADVVGRFKDYCNKRDGKGQEPGPRTERGNSGSRLSGKRQEQIESASGARTSGPGAASGIPEDGDPETLWKQFDDMERRNRA